MKEKDMGVENFRVHCLLLFLAQLQSIFMFSYLFWGKFNGEHPRFDNLRAQKCLMLPALQWRDIS
jgi:hypothetical protein